MILFLKKIIKIVNESGFFSVLVDETTDVSVKEQLTLCVRWGRGRNLHVVPLLMLYSHS